MSFVYQSGDIIYERYVIFDKLGQGGNAITYAARDLSTEEQVAIKILSLKKLDSWKKVELFEREAKILQQLKHSAIPKYIDYFQIETKSDNLFYIVQELAPGKSLATLIESGWQPDEITIKEIAEQILEILIYLQQLIPPVIHRDLKPQNIIRGDDNKIFLVDFGAVQDTYHHTVMGSTVVGTYGYMAPEQFRGQAFLSTDLYGLGTTLLFLLTGQSPTELPEKKLKIDFRNSVKISSGFADWIDKLIEPSHEYRLPSAEAALEVLQGKQSLSSYITQRPPKYTAVSLTKTEDKLIVTIPPALFYQQCDRKILFYLLAWHIVFVLTSLGMSASFPKYNIPLLIYISCLIGENFVVDSFAVVFLIIKRIILITFSIYSLFILVVFGLFGIFEPSLNQLIYCLVIYFDYLLIAKLRVSTIRNLLFTTNLEFHLQQQKIRITRKIFNITQVDFECGIKKSIFKMKKNDDSLSLCVYADANEEEIENYEIGRLLTNLEKSWLCEEINKQIENNYSK